MKTFSSKNISSYDKKVKIMRKKKKSKTSGHIIKNPSYKQINDLSEINFTEEVDSVDYDYFNNNQNNYSKDNGKDRGKDKGKDINLYKLESNHWLNFNDLDYIQEESFGEEQNENNTLVISNKGIVHDYFKAKPKEEKRPKRK